MAEATNDTTPKAAKNAPTCALNKREEFVKAAMQGLCSKEINSVERLADKAVEIADATLAAMKRK